MTLATGWFLIASPRKAAMGCALFLGWVRSPQLRLWRIIQGWPASRVSLLALPNLLWLSSLLPIPNLTLSLLQLPNLLKLRLLSPLLLPSVLPLLNLKGECPCFPNFLPLRLPLQSHLVPLLFCPPPLPPNLHQGLSNTIACKGSRGSWGICRLSNLFWV